MGANDHGRFASGGAASEVSERLTDRRSEGSTFISVYARRATLLGQGFVYQSDAAAAEREALQTYVERGSL
jgi:hypothetical protein